MTSDGREARALAFSSHDQHFDQELPHLAARPQRGALVEIVAQRLESAGALQLGQRQCPHEGQDVVADLPGR